MKKQFHLLMMSSLILMATGCATSRSSVNLVLPELAVSSPNGKQVFIRSVVDKREFQARPSIPEIPSLKGGVDGVPAEIKSRAIARKRNGYGKAMGDVLLEEGNSVEKMVYQAARNSLASLGYEVTNKKEEARAGAIVMDISIEKFWAWLNPGAWAITVNSQMSATHTIESAGSKIEPIVIKAETSTSNQVVTNSDWQQAAQLLLTSYIQQGQREFKKINEA